MNRYEYTKILRDTDGKRFRRNTIYPKIKPKNSDEIYMTQERDRWDTLAHIYYNDSTLWWIIARANPRHFKGSLACPVAVYLVIPTEITDILSELERLNSTEL
jgi:hypothetical protein|tara:strand:+ start:585 stop:893 length:309 start_codon:yes stop_codon:yes gene_type:complete